LIGGKVQDAGYSTQLLLSVVAGSGDALNSPLDFNPTFFSFHCILTESGMLANDVSHNDMAYYQRVIASNESDVIIATNLEPSSLLKPERNGNQKWIMDGLRWCGLLHLSPVELDEVVGIVFRYLFTIDERVIREMLLARESLGIAGVPYTALHIRTGFAGMGEQFEELSHHPKLEHNVSKWHSAMQCAREMADRHLGHDSPIFLATDSNLVKDIAISKYSHRIRTLRNTLVHVDRLAKQPHVPGDTEVEGVIVVWVEFLILAQAETLVRGDSSYSWIAGLLCGLHGNRTLSTEHCRSQSKGIV
jgi:hypothetical protein